MQDADVKDCVQHCCVLSLAPIFGRIGVAVKVPYVVSAVDGQYQRVGTPLKFCFRFCLLLFQVIGITDSQASVLNIRYCLRSFRGKAIRVLTISPLIIIQFILVLSLIKLG